VLLAKSSERHRRVQHLRCDQCGERQRHRRRKVKVQRMGPDAGASQETDF